MKISNFIQAASQELREGIYHQLNKCSPAVGRLCALPVSVLDIAIDTLKFPLTVIESIVKFPLNLIGALFSHNECSIKDALFCADFALKGIAITNVNLILAPIKIIYQVFAIVIDPQSVNAFDYYKPTFKPILSPIL